MSYLSGLTQAQRDAKLETIQFVKEPMKFASKSYDYSEANILNYSQIFSTIGSHLVGMPQPEVFRNGDSIQFHDYRGIGTFYAVWLRKGLIEHSEVFLEKFWNTEVPPEDMHGDDDDEQEEDDEEEKGTRKKAKKLKIPVFFNREADGSHSDGKHDCYLFKHPDENGYSLSPALSSLPPRYYKTHEFNMMIFDPLLTHSQSHYGQIIAKAKKSDEFKADETFPLDFVGSWDEDLGEGDELEWMPLYEATADLGLDENYFTEIRDVFSRHFEGSVGDSSVAPTVAVAVKEATFGGYDGEH